MAGYMTKLNGHVYEGSYTSGEALLNGRFVERTANGVKYITATKDMVLAVKEKLTMWGKPTVRLIVTAPGANEIYFVENEWDIDDSKAYNTADYSLPSGELVKMHRPLAGEELVMDITSVLYAALAIGDTVNPATGGTVAAVVVEGGGN